MTTQLKPVQRKPLSRQTIRVRLESDREMLAAVIFLAGKLMSHNDDAWEETQADDPPEFAAASRLGRAA